MTGEESLQVLIDQLKELLNKEGFVHVYDWHDEPGTTYPPHAHKGEVTIYIVQGSVTFHFTEPDVHGMQDVPLTFGACFKVPVGREHTATVGPEGCTYVVGEMIEGDS